MSINASSTKDTQQVMQILADDVQNTFDARLNGTRILIVSAWLSAKLEMLRHIHSMGVKIVVVDMPDPDIQQYIDAGLLEAHIEADIDAPEQFDAIMTAIHDSGMAFNGVATLIEFYTPLTAKIAAALGLPGHPVKTAAIARNKYETRKLCEAAGIASPRFALIDSLDDLERCAEIVGFPCVLKPSKGAASTDVYFVEDLATLQERYNQIIARVRAYEPHETVHSISGSVWADARMIVEEYLDGDEFDVDCLLSGGEMVFSSITSEKPQPHMIETGAFLPARYPQERQDELVAFVQQILASLGFRDGVFHVEMKYTSKGPRLIEVNARIGGGPIYRMVRRVWGVDLIEQYLLTCLGYKITPQKAAEPLAHIASEIIVAPYSGIVLHDEFLQHLQQDPRIVYFQVYTVAGRHIHGPQNRVPEWLGEVIVHGKSPQAADAILHDVVNSIELPLAEMQTIEYQAVTLDTRNNS